MFWFSFRDNSESGGSRPGSSQRPGSDEGLPEIPDPSVAAQNATQQDQPKLESAVPGTSAGITGKLHEQFQTRWNRWVPH